MPLEFETAPPIKSAAPDQPRLAEWLTRQSVGTKDRMAFTEQLALLLETGMALHTALKALQAQSQNPAMRKIIQALATDVESGQRFSQALARHPELFSTTYVHLVAAS
jgi:type IV pilus assembly protein PilC